MCLHGRRSCLEAGNLDMISESNSNIINCCGGFVKISCNFVYEVQMVMEIMLELSHAPHTTAQTIMHYLLCYLRFLCLLVLFHFHKSRKVGFALSCNLGFYESYSI